MYAFQHTGAARIDRLFSALLGVGEEDTDFQTAVDEESNILVVTAEEEVHQRLTELIERMDKPALTSQSPIRFYKLKNLTAQEVLTTLLTLTGRQSPILPRQLPNTIGRIRPEGGFFPVTGPNRLPTSAYGPLDPYTPYTLSPYAPFPYNPTAPRVINPLPPPPSYTGATGVTTPETAAQSETTFAETAASQTPQAPLVTNEPLTTLLARAQVTADIATNSIIVAADPTVQKVYEQLIKQLDVRRPQVMIEAKVVVLNTGDDFALGVEVAYGDRVGKKRAFNFTQFGLSEVDPLTGALAAIPGLGLNSVLVDPDAADVVLRALTSHRRARIVSSPRILVNDNATGILSSVEEVPFTSVNASQTVATTSFAGFADAGTTIVVTPHISEDGHLQLEYKITLNDFVGTGGDGIPPQRQTDEIESSVTVPDGHTIVVGGLKRRANAATVDSIPFIENIPILNILAMNRSKSRDDSSLFVFLRPVILREDRFEDLKFLSGEASGQACIQGDHPSSEPLLIGETEICETDPLSEETGP